MHDPFVVELFEGPPRPLQIIRFDARSEEALRAASSVLTKSDSSYPFKMLTVFARMAGVVSAKYSAKSSSRSVITIRALAFRTSRSRPALTRLAHARFNPQKKSVRV